MSKVFEQGIDNIATQSGCDYDFVVDMYSHINDKYGNVDWQQFARGVTNFDWSARGNGRFDIVLADLWMKSSYTYDYLFDRLVDMIYDPDDEGDWSYFVGVTMEHDW